MIDTIHLFGPLDKKLIALLRSLTPEEWHKPTIARAWNVKDVAAHLLDGNIRTISSNRDKYPGLNSGPIQSYQDLLDFLNRINAEWVTAMKRISPAALTDWLEATGTQYTALMLAANLQAPAPFAVSWAGDEESPNWFHIAREYTEKWHHQQQIRDAVGKPGIMTRELYYPVLDTFMMALPHTYRNIPAPNGTVIQVTVTGEGGGDWFITRTGKWQLSRESHSPVAAHTIIDGSQAWKLFTKSWRRQDIAQFVSVEGDIVLGEAALEMIAVMA
ncbi:MAG: maleylpyruvate isomerase family mycothiol-dependent enzyme [Bacteroidetes bacterium]|nr:maleylpyruvate isomerase family mycothiol-dependent enzyme [Bacteroidota bacterium]